MAALYVSASVFTNAHFMADSGGYVVSILAYAGVDEYVVENPTINNFRAENSFWDFGHLLWRPLGLLLFKIFRPLSSLVIGPDPAHNVMFLLMAVNFVAGLVSAVAAVPSDRLAYRPALARSFCRRLFHLLQRLF